MSDLSGIRDKAIKAGSQACTLDKEKKYNEAVKKYIESIELYQHLARCNPYFRKIKNQMIKISHWLTNT